MEENKTKKRLENYLRKFLKDEKGTIPIEEALRRAKKKWGKK